MVLAPLMILPVPRVIYSPRYNISLFGLERLHPFDSQKYGRAWRVQRKQFAKQRNALAVRPACRRFDDSANDRRAGSVGIGWPYIVGRVESTKPDTAAAFLAGSFPPIPWLSTNARPMTRATQMMPSKTKMAMAIPFPWFFLAS